MKNVEFYTYNNEVWYRDGEISEKLTERSEVIPYMVDNLTQFFPEAYKALEKEYKGILDLRLKKFRIVQRFCKCNFGQIDNVMDIDGFGRFNFERVDCPLRGECRLENIVCSPKFNTCISDSENRVLELLYKGVGKEEIADKLCLSPFTVKNHTANAFARLNIHSVAEFMVYARENNLYKED
jgi:DNA-binding CsgD family transcriptional regulator